MPLITRREILQWLGLGGLAAAGACSSSKTASPGAGPDAGSSPAPDAGPGAGADAGADAGMAPSPDERWAVLAEIRDAVQKSPDHLLAQAKRLIATRDAGAIFAFVRDEILTLPVFVHEAAGFVDDALVAVRWGPRGTLRGGLGTPRDKVDLLAWMLGQAGFTVETLQGVMTRDAVTVELRRSRPREFQLTVDDATATRWRRVFALGAPGPVPEPLDPDGREANALADALLPLLPSTVGQTDPGDVPTRMPLVGLRDAGMMRVLNPFVPGAQPGEANATSISALGGRNAYPRATVRLTYNTTDNPYVDHEAVVGDWGLDELVGRRIHAQFQPLFSRGAWALAEPGSASAYMPVLAFQGPDVSRDDANMKTATGDVLKPDGGRIVVEGGQVRVDGRRVPAGLADPAVIGRVSTARLTVDPSTYPQVSARLVLLDDAMRPVTGLSASAFTLTEEGKSRPAIVTGPLDPVARIAILFDGSSSIPPAFLLPARRASVVRAIVTAVQPVSAGALFRVGGINFRPVWASDWSSDPTVLENAALAITAEGDQLWSAYAGAARDGASLVVIVSDGEATDEIEEGGEPLVRIGPPAVTLSVVEADHGIFPELTRRTGGASASVTMEADAAAAVARFAGSNTALPYAVTWPGLEQGPSLRHVSLKLRGSMVQADATYTVPEAMARQQPLRIAGLFLSVGFSYESPVVRRIAGKQPGVGGRNATDDDCANARAALSGVHILSFEGGSPPFAHWADDWLSAALAQCPFQEALERHDGRALIAAIESGEGQGVPEVLAVLHGSLSDSGAEAHPVKCRVARVSSFLRPAAGGMARAVRVLDLLHNARFDSLAAARTERVRTTLRRTARAALLEKAVGEVAAYDRLRGVPLAAATSDTIGAVWPMLSSTERAFWERMLAGWQYQVLLLPRDPAVHACWAVHPETGSLLGVLDDGSGGSRAEVCAILQRVQTMLAGLAMIGTYAGASFGFGAWLSFIKVYCTLVLESAVAILTLDEESSSVPDLDRALLDFGCDLAFGAATDRLSGSASAAVARFGRYYAYGLSINDILQAHNLSNLSCSNAILGMRRGVC